MAQSSSNFNLTDTEYGKAQQQEMFESNREYQFVYIADFVPYGSYTERVAGHKFANKRRAGRALVMGAIAGVLTIARGVITLHYWLTRTSTAGISILGSSLSLAGYFMMALNAIYSYDANESDEITLLMAVVSNLALAWVILKAILRLERCNKFPFVKRRQASDAERASGRLEFGQRGAPIVFGVSALLYDYADLRRARG